jgi:hypothetical protein
MRRETYSGARQQVGGRFHKSLKKDGREEPVEGIQHITGMYGLRCLTLLVSLYLVKMPTCIWQ